MMMSLRSCCFGVLATILAHAPTSFGQSSVSAVPNLSEDTIRTKYENTSQLPLGISFASTIGLIKRVNDIDPEAAANIVEKGMGIDTEAAYRFVHSLVSSSMSYDQASDAIGDQIACDGRFPKAIGDDAYQLIADIDDAHEALALEHYNSFASKLGAEQAAKFSQWLERRKLSIVYVKIDHKAFAVANGQSDIDMRMAQLCN